MNNITIPLLIVGVMIGVGLIIKNDSIQKDNNIAEKNAPQLEDVSSLQSGSETAELFPMSIESLRQRSYPGDAFTIEETLPNGTDYQQYRVSYRSEGLKIYGLLTIPLTPKPESGYPAILFIHGYIPPKQYSTTGSYPTYQATLARSGFITFKPDLRGHGESEGEAVSAHFSEKYTVDTLYALSYLKKYPDVDPNRIGYWGHSNGGEIGLRVLVISPDIKAASLWAGVVGNYKDMFETYNDQIPFLQNIRETPLIRENGLPTENPEFWGQLDPYSYLEGITTPVQLQHATGDASVPITLSQHLNEELKKAGKNVEYFEYIGDDHNIGNNSGKAWQRSIEFFRKNLR